MSGLGINERFKGHNFGLCRLCGKDHGKYNKPMLGKHHSEETKEKISVGNKGKRQSKETKKRISEALKGEKSPLYGNPLSDERRKKISISKRGMTLSDEHKEKISVANKGRRCSEETKKKLSVVKTGRHHSNETRKKIGEISRAQWANGIYKEARLGTGVSGKRTDLNNQFFRSTWEANVARILNFWGIKWEYEVKWIPCNIGTKKHLIDFYLPETDSYLDIYSHMDKRHLEDFYGVYTSGLRVQLIGPDIYKDLEKEFKDKLPFWENGRSGGYIESENHKA